MSRLLFVSIFLLLNAGLAISLPQVAIRELTGLAPKASRFRLPSFPNGTTPAPDPFATVSKACKTALSELMKTPLTAIAFADASGKPGSGFFSGNLVWLGSYAQCKNITSAKYCLAPDVKVKFTGQPMVVPIEWGVCVPAVCTEQDVAFAFKEIIKGFQAVTEILAKENVSLPVHFVEPDEDFLIACAHPSEWTTGPIITLVICIIIACLCITGTIIDLCVVQGSWKFWLSSGSERAQYSTSEERAGLLSDSDTSPLIQRNGYDVNPDDSPQIQFKQPSLEERGFLVRFLTCFSLTRNTSKIMDCNAPPGAITSVNGVRVLSMWWVILGHTYLLLLMFRLINDLALGIQITHRFSFQAVNSAFFSVDSFFLSSGLLVGYLAFRRMDKNDGRLPLFQFYFHRFWRLTPSYMFAILFYANLFQFLGEGPLWYVSQQRTPCDDYWWTNLLYINNFHPASIMKECAGWSWYLANDMQFYVISPLLLFIIYRLKWKGLLIGVGGLLQISLIVTAVIIGVYNTDVLENEAIERGFQNDPNRGSYSDLVYIKPYCRISPYLVGIALGYLLHVEKTAPGKSPLNKIPKQIVCVVGWFVATGLGVTVVYGIYTVTKPGGTPFTKAENIIYGTFSRFVWGLALAWVIYACQKGYGSLVNKFLSASYWIPLSRLTYSAYLMHPIVLTAYFGSFQHTTEYSDMLFAFYFAAVVVMSYAAAFVLAVCVEYPMMQLENVLFFRKKTL